MTASIISAGLVHLIGGGADDNRNDWFHAAMRWILGLLTPGTTWLQGVGFGAAVHRHGRGLATWGAQPMISHAKASGGFVPLRHANNNLPPLIVTTNTTLNGTIAAIVARTDKLMNPLGSWLSNLAKAVANLPARVNAFGINL